MAGSLGEHFLGGNDDVWKSRKLGYNVKRVETCPDLLPHFQGLYCLHTAKEICSTSFGI